MGKRRRNNADEARKDAARGIVLTPRQLLAKGEVLSGNAVNEATAITAMDNNDDAFRTQHAVTPDYDPLALINFVEVTPHVMPSIAAYAHNIEGYGYRRIVKQPWMEDLEGEDAEQSVRAAMVIEQWAQSQDDALAADAEKSEIRERLAALKVKRDDAVSKARTARTVAKWQKEIDAAEEELAEAEAETPEGAEEITDEDVNNKLREIEVEIRREEFIFDAFFENCCSNMSFVKLRRIVRQDIETHGWGCIEMERDGYERLRRLSYVPAYTVRPLVDPGELIEVLEHDPVSPLSSEERQISVKRRFQVFVQIVKSQKIYFKTPGDPRVVSRTTGKIYKTEAEMRHKDNEGPDAQPANELLWIPLHSPKSLMPPPRWIGNLLQVLGGREADETNYYYLKNNAIPYGLLFCSGGTIPNDIRARLEYEIDSEMRGSEGAGKILVIQAKPMGKASSDGRTVLPELTFQSLRDAHEQDSLFTGYDERGADRIGASFRLSPILRGYTPTNLNRATALAAIMLAEQQVFEPERQDIDWIINKSILTELGIRFLLFVSNSPATRTVEDVVEIIKAAAPHGGILPTEIRELIEDLFNRKFTKIKDGWAQVPMVMTLAGFGDGAAGEAPGLGGDMDGALDDEDTDVGRALATIEARVSAVVQSVMASYGQDVEVSAMLVDREGGDVPSGE
jgi:capsid portal protein